MGGYVLMASPTLYPGQTVTARLSASHTLSGPVQVGLYVKAYGSDDSLGLHRAPTQRLAPGEEADLAWLVPDFGGQPIAEVGLEITSDVSASEASVDGSLLLDRLTWTGTPDLTLRKPDGGGTVWGQAWVNGADEFSTRWASAGMTYRVIQNRGTGLVSQGEAAWAEYVVSAEVRPHLAARLGLCAAVRGLRRYVALVLDADKHIRLIRQHDKECQVLAELAVTPDLKAAWQAEQPILLSLTVGRDSLTAQAGTETVTVLGDVLPHMGAVGLLVEEGHAEFGAVQVSGLTPARCVC
jgi:hypothetical protein